MGPINLIGLSILGVALLWALNLIYSSQRVHRDDWLRRLLTTAGWLLLVSGILGVLVGLAGVLSLLMWLIVLVILAMSVNRYRDSERRGLLWALAVAAEKGIPLNQAVRAFANERTMSMGGRAMRLADLLESGMPLDAALARTNPLPLDALLAARVGTEMGQLGPALRRTIEQVDLFEGTMRHALERTLYLMLVALAMLGVTTFMMIKIVPVIAKMMSEFDLAMPAPTELLIAISTQFANYWYLLVPLYIILPACCFLGLLYYVGWLHYDLPIVSRFWLRSDGSMVLRSLALAVRQKRAIPETVEMLGEVYPKAGVRRRLRKAAYQIRGGVHWCDSLRSAGLIRGGEAAVIRSAERVGNLAWALDELAEAILRRMALRLKLIVNAVFPVLILIFGFFVLLCAVGMLMPLAALIQGLS